MKILGIEFGAWSLKAVELDSRFRRLEIQDLHQIRLPLEVSDPVATYKAAVANLLGRLPSHAEKLVTSLPASQTALRFLTLPIKQRRKVEQSYKFELEDSLPFDLEDTITEHHITRHGEGSQVFAAVALKKHIQSHLDWLNAVGIDPDWLTFEGMGLVNYYLSSLAGQPKTDDEESEGPVLIIDVGHLKTNFAFIHQGRLEFFRSVPWGGHSVTQSIATAINLSLEEAEEAKIRDLNLDLSNEKTASHHYDLFTSASRAFIPFVTDAQHSMVTYRSQHKKEVSQILLTGGTAQTKGFTKFVTDHLRKPASLLYTGMQVMRFGRDMEGSQVLSFGESIGRAMVFSRKAPLLFNFRKHEMAKGTSLTEVTSFLKQPNVVSLLKYGSFLAIVLLAHVLIATPIAENSAKAADKDLKKAFGQTFRAVNRKLAKNLTKNPKKLEKFIKQKIRESSQKLRWMSKKRVSMISLVKDISNAIPADVKVDINTIKIDDRTFQIEGVIYEGDLKKITATLKDITFFDKVSVTKNGQRFTYKGNVSREVVNESKN